MRGQIYKQDFPDLGCHEFLCYKDGWLLTSKRDFPVSLFFLDPFTRERVYLPWKDYQCIAFSAARTLASCLVVSILSANIWSGFKIKTCRPGETKWTSHRYPTNRPGHLEWSKCVFSNGMFYCLSTCGHLGVFDPTRAAWNILPVKPCPAFLSQTGLARLRETRLLVMEHEGDVYVISTSKKASVFKLDLKRKVWEEKRELGGLTVFASQPTSLTRAGLLRERNRIYPSHEAHKGVYYNLADDKYSSHRPPVMNYLSDRIAWVDPPLNEANLSPYDGINY
ncbi:PREDICTED: F-box/kelch-repeat protein At3g18720-like [Camelina sativa]|uniref:F-box/kelch-repeat protein At3g18720-like n=1 Tax=Camelina sativa TaxID=90675 RepID=A0ABM0WPQ3_CAMSA|nr:PREDICTED: F-box/kelch-repeat protein At3g18720-like [Camelina sativa]